MAETASEKALKTAHIPTFNEIFQVIDFTYISIGQADVYRKNKRHSPLYDSMQKILYWAGFANLFYLVVGESTYGYKVIKSASIANFLYFTELMPCFILSSYCLMKTYQIYAKRNLVGKIIEELEQIWPEDDPEYRKIIYQCMVPTRKFLLLYTVATNVLSTVFNCFPILIMLVNYINGEHVQWLIPYYIVYPFDWESSIVLYILTYLTHIYGGWFTTAGVSSVDCFFCILMAHLCMHFQIICVKIENMANHKEGLSQEERWKEERQRLKSVIRYHNQIIRLVSEVQDIFSLVLFINTVASSFMICLLTFAITISPIERLIKYFLFLFSSMIQILMISWYGDGLVCDSKAVQIAAYNCNWPDSNPALRKGILMLSLRGCFPESINAMGFTKLSLVTFSSILRVSWSYFTLMRTMYFKITSLE